MYLVALNFLSATHEIIIMLLSFVGITRKTPMVMFTQKHYKQAVITHILLAFVFKRLLFVRTGISSKKKNLNFFY